MQHRSKSHQTTETELESGRHTWLWVVLGIASLLIILQTFGIFKTVDRQSAASWVDLNSAEYQNRPMPQKRPEKPAPQVEATLQEISQEFEGQIFSDIRTANEQKGWGLSDDEARFYDAMRARYGQAQGNWLSVVRRSYETYRVLRDVFGGESTTILRNPQQANAIFARISDLFGVPTTESRNFAQSSQAQMLSDWAIFVESHKRK